MGSIKLFVCCHKKSIVPKHPVLVPIQVGTALSGQRFNGYRHDDTGDNISYRNKSYCELTAQYWVWKNEGADYVGFFHYRRYLVPNEKSKKPYYTTSSPTKHRLKQWGYQNIEERIQNYDVITPIPEDMHVSIREHYYHAPHHYKKDLDLIEEIVRRRNPEMSNALEKYFSGTKAYFGNIYIMKMQFFQSYCEWLFPILEEYDQMADKTGYSTQELRVNGYLAERLFGVWITYVQDDLSVVEWPRVHFIPEKKERIKKQVQNFLLPAGSLRRAWLKKWIKK